MSGRLVLAALSLAAISTTVRAHELPKETVRELVRVQGYRSPAPAGTKVARELTLVAIGRQVPFAATEWRVFAFYDPTGKPTPAEKTQLILQGERAQLSAIVSSRPEQRITILAERRPGSTDLFVLSVDLCP